MRSHEDLDAWRRAVDFAVAVYAATKDFPENERFGLSSQLRRAAVSIASNIAEGAARSGEKEFLHFLSFSAGSASEVSTHLAIAHKAGIGEPEVLMRLAEEVKIISKMLHGLIRTLRSR